MLLGTLAFATLVVGQLLTAWVIAFVGSGQDFGSYWIAASRTAAGGTPYDWLDVDRPIMGDETEYVYPPLLAVLLAPFTSWLNYSSARALWLLFSVVCLVVGIVLTWRASGLQATSNKRLVAWAAIALLPAISITLAVGQLSCQLLLIVVGIYMLGRGRYRVAAGALLGFGVYLKVFPVAIGGYLLLRRQWTAAIVSAIIGTALVIFTVLAIGWAPHQVYLSLVLPVQSRLFGLPQNVSLTGFVTHLMMPNAYTMPIVSNEWAGRMLVAVSTIALIAASGYAVWKCRGRGSWDAPAYALTLVAALLITPANGSYNLILAIFPLAVAIARTPANATGASALLAIAIILLGLPTDLCDLLPVRTWCFDYWVANSLPTAELPWRVGWANLLTAGPFYSLLLVWWLLFRVCIRSASAEPGFAGAEGLRRGILD